MRVVIGGGGMVGRELARKLMAQKHDVIVIDEDKETCDNLYADLGVVAIQGSPGHVEILNEAETAKADLVVAAALSDADNLACAILAKSLGVPQVIVRLHNPAYENAYRIAGVNGIVRVTDLMVNQIMLEITFPKAQNIFTIGQGRANIFMVIVPPGATAAGRTVRDIAEERAFPEQCVFIAASNPEEETFAIPRGDQVIHEGDELYLVARGDGVGRAIEFLTAQRA